RDWSSDVCSSDLALDFLIHRKQIDSYGIRPIKGILLAGPPGTGKTLMAKAAARYTDSVFVSASGSEFVEMYVGVGAQRIRQLFREARRRAKKIGRASCRERAQNPRASAAR